MPPVSKNSFKYVQNHWTACISSSGGTGAPRVLTENSFFKFSCTSRTFTQFIPRVTQSAPNVILHYIAMVFCNLHCINYTQLANIRGDLQNTSMLDWYGCLTQNIYQHPQDRCMNKTVSCFNASDTHALC